MSEKATVPATVFEVDIDQVHPNPDNPRTIKDANFKKLVKSIRDFPAMLWKRPPVVVTTPNGYMSLGGNKRTDAARAAGYKRIPVMLADEWDTDQRKRFVVLDNDQAGEWDFKMLTEQYSLSELLAETSIVIPKSLLSSTRGQEDDVPEAPKTPTTKLGDVWILGHHRLMCGDSTSADAMATLMRDGKATMSFTDPPWNVAIGQDSNPRHRQRKGLANDALPAVEFSAFIHAFSAQLSAHVTGDIYCVLGASEWPTLDTCLRSAGFHWSATIIWVKDVFVLGRSKYHRRYEPLWYGWARGGKSSFQGDRNLNDVWEIPRPRKSVEHPTMKPIELVKRAVVASSAIGDIVLDQFSGSGSTIIACEGTSRRGYAMELAPEYCDVGVLRWQDLTGKEAVLEATGQTYAQVQEDRMG